MPWQLDQCVKTSAGDVAAGTSGDGTALILAHGWPWSSFSWHRIIPELEKHFRVYWYDMPGYGRSAKTENQRTSLDVQGQVFAEMIEQSSLGCRKMDVGASIGSLRRLMRDILLKLSHCSEIFVAQ